MALAAIGGLLAALGCAPGRARHARPRFIGLAADGRPDTCPERAVDPFGDGTPAPDDARCSFRDPGGAVVELRGQVVTEPEAATPGDPVAGAGIVLSAVDPDSGARREVARTHADAQGSFSIGAMLRPGRYTIGMTGAPATARSFQIDKAGQAPESILLIVPRSMAAPR